MPYPHVHHIRLHMVHIQDILNSFSQSTNLDFKYQNIEQKAFGWLFTPYVVR